METIRHELKEVDEEIYDLLAKEKTRQTESLNLIAAENYTSKAVQQALGSCPINKYSKGRPGDRYYSGTENIDAIELLCEKRALDAYNLCPHIWGVNVQPLSGSPANLAVYMAVVGPGGRLMGLDVPDGGHLTHGFINLKKKMSSSSIFFESLPFRVDRKTGIIDYDTLKQSARLFKPNLIIAGASSYSRNLDYARFRKIADDVDCLLMADMAHISGLVASSVIPSPFEYCDIVTTTTQKSMRGPRSGLIFYRKGERRVLNGHKLMYNLEARINEAVFPGLQGGPHNHQIAAVAVALKQTQTAEFKEYQSQILANAKVLANNLLSLGYTMLTGGTDNHLVVLDMRPLNLDGARGEKVLDLMNISSNKCPYPGDEDALKPSGLRFGTPALTSRQMKEDDMKKVADFINEGLQLGKEAAAICGPTLANFEKIFEKDLELKKRLEHLKHEVKKFAESFPMPGNEDI